MLQSNYLGTLNVVLQPPFQLGDTPEGARLIVNAVGGTFEGPRISASILPNGGDWARLRPNGSGAVDVRGLLQTQDGELVFLRFEGRFVIPPQLMAAVFVPQSSEMVDPSEYYFRITPAFETSSKHYDWLNNIVSVGVGSFGIGSVSYDIYEIL